jgi:chromatin segregation and condensation protein Rec8/ScpA/Scc1 (kleisin family)
MFGAIKYFNLLPKPDEEEKEEEEEEEDAV